MVVLQNSGKVILIFSVNMSGAFQGYAQMMSSVGWRRDNVWSQGSSRSNPWGRSFKVEWLRLNDLPFQKTLHLKNPLNEYKPVKISRDCQVFLIINIKCFLISLCCITFLEEWFKIWLDILSYFRSCLQMLEKLFVSFLMGRMMCTAYRTGNNFSTLADAFIYLFINLVMSV